MKSATISADIISYTALSVRDKRNIITKIQEFIEKLHQKYPQEKFLGRIVQGDSIEFAMQSPRHALRIALLLKCYVKSLEMIEPNSKDKRIKYFKEHGVRLALAVAPLTNLDLEAGLIDGEAIYLSGRAIKSLSTSNKQKVVIKQSLFFCSTDQEQENRFDALFSLLDVLLAKSSGKQCEVLYYKLLGCTEKEISTKLSKSQSTISQHSTAAGWQSIEKSVIYFENYIV